MILIDVHYLGRLGVTFGFFDPGVPDLFMAFANARHLRKVCGPDSFGMKIQNVLIAGIPNAALGEDVHIAVTRMGGVNPVTEGFAFTQQHI